MNKRTKILAIGSAVLLCSSIGYRVYDSQAASNTANVNKAKPTLTAKVNSGASENTVVRIPPKGRISESIDSLARQIIANAPNQEEAYTFLVEAKSYRIQDLRARRAKGKAEESKANYDSELWQKKIGQIDNELAKDLEKDSIDTQAGSHDPYKGASSFSQKVDYKAPTKKEVSLDSFSLRAIIKEGADYVARLSFGERSLPAKVGYKLLGKVDVVSITSNEVVLSMGDNQVTLYTY